MVIGDAIDYNTAVNEVRAGRNVFTVTKSEAKQVAYAAGGNREPYQDKKHNVSEPNYYYHYHIYNHENGAHIWYPY